MINRGILFHSLLGKLSAVIVLLFTTVHVMAWDTLPDENGKYDEFYDRPIKSIELIDAGGRVVRTRQNMRTAFTKEDLKSLPSGVYYQKIIFMDGQSLLQKMMR